MLIYIWFCVITQAFMPGGDRLASLSSGSLEAHLRAEIDRPALIGAASHIARYTPLSARAI